MGLQIRHARSAPKTLASKAWSKFWRIYRRERKEREKREKRERERKETERKREKVCRDGKMSRERSRDKIEGQYISVSSC